jgi:hypothetical protein
MEQSRHA